METKFNIKNYIREINDFPTNGIKFYDISPLLGDGPNFRQTIHEMSEPLRGNVDKLVGFDARGFLFAAAMSLELGVGMAMLRKPGKLPGQTESINYDLEYGANCLEIQSDSIRPGERIALIDDVIATGGTAIAGIKLVQKLGGNITSFNTLINLSGLGGSTKIQEAGVTVHSIVEM